MRANAVNSDSDASSASTSAPAQDTSAVASTSAPTPSNSSTSASSGGNTGLAGGAVAAGAALFLATRLLTGGPSMAALEQQAVPLELALSNGKPTVVEFYASW